jgi:5-(carboxyamino)imidazole ribonucleotide mutase
MPPPCHPDDRPYNRPLLFRAFRGIDGGEAGCDHHGQPIRLAHHEAHCRYARCTGHRLRGEDRTPERHSTFTKAAKAQGFKIIIAGAGGAAHLPGVTAALTTLPVFGVPVESKALSGVDSLYSIVQMPPGVPVGTLAIGRAGAINAALLAASVLALADGELAKRLEAWRQRQTDAVPETPEDGKS